MKAFKIFLTLVYFIFITAVSALVLALTSDPHPHQMIFVPVWFQVGWWSLVVGSYGVLGWNFFKLWRAR